MEAFFETADSREVTRDGQTVEIVTKWCAFHTDDEAEVEQRALMETPATYRGLVRGAMHTMPQKGGVWFVEVPYRLLAPGQGLDTGDAGTGGGGDGGDGGSPPPTAPGGDEPLGPGYGLEISANSVHITKSVFTRYARTPSDDPTSKGKGTAKRYGGAIGVSGDSGVAGCDVITPAVSLTVTTGRGRMTLNEVRKRIGLVGRTNDKTFYGFQVGEVLYMGCSIQWASTRWTLADRLGINLNRKGVVIGSDVGDWKASTDYLVGDEVGNGGGVYVCKTAGTSAGSGGPTGETTGITDGGCTWDFVEPRGVTLPEVRGWDYVWSRFAPQVLNNELAPRTVGIYVEQVYREDNFAALGIGT
jgi:hypothetical protein